MDTEKPVEEFTTAEQLRRRVFVPIEHPTSAGTHVFRTCDRTVYRRDEQGVIRRMHPKPQTKKERRRAKH